MRKIVKTALGVTVCAVLMAVAGGGAVGTASAEATPSLDCMRDSSRLCIRWCRVDTRTPRYPCGLGSVPNPSLTGTYTFTVPMSAAIQDATGVDGDPGASGTATLRL